MLRTPFRQRFCAGSYKYGHEGGVNTVTEGVQIRSLEVTEVNVTRTTHGHISHAELQIRDRFCIKTPQTTHLQDDVSSRRDKAQHSTNESPRTIIDHRPHLNAPMD